jgi:hypothetical protein
MKKSIYILFILSVSLLHSYSYGQSSTLNSVTIEWVDFSIETFADVSCESFDKSFKKEKRVKYIFNKADLMEFQALLKGFKSVQNKQSFDTRGSINFIIGKTENKYCFNVFGYFYKNGKYYFNKQLLIFITDKIFIQHHPKYLDTLRQYE